MQSSPFVDPMATGSHAETLLNPALMDHGLDSEIQLHNEDIVAHEHDDNHLVRRVIRRELRIWLTPAFS